MFIKILLWTIAAVALLILLLLSISAMLVDPRKEYAKNSPYYRALLNISTAVGMKLLRIHVTINGKEKLPQNTRFLLVSNHRSNFDPIVTWYALREQKIAFVSKPENFRIPIFGRIIRKCCFLPIDREDARKAMGTINSAAELLESNEVSVGIYPEGTRSRADALLPFHNGVFKIAKKANAPIVVNVGFRHGSNSTKLVSSPQSGNTEHSRRDPGPRGSANENGRDRRNNKRTDYR